MPDARPSTPLLDGELLAGQYRVERLLGEGGNGAVFAVRDERSGAAVALKLLLDCDDPERVTRFLREARATMRLSSEHVVRVLEVGSVNGKTPFMVMERLEGRTLKDLGKETAVDEALAADLVLQACEGLAHAHAQGIIHRDVKPSNLFVTNARVLKVLDFGISKVSSQSDYEKTATVTNSEAILGSPHFISPEQLRNAAKVDERADVWSLGVVLYHLLAKRYPFDGPSLAEIFVAIMHRKLQPIATASPAMESIVARCLERDPALRFADVGELARALGPLAPQRSLLVEQIVGIVGDSRSRRVASSEDAGREGTVSLDVGPVSSTFVEAKPPPGVMEAVFDERRPTEPPLPSAPPSLDASSFPRSDARTVSTREPKRSRVPAILAIGLGIVLVVATWRIASALRTEPSASARPPDSPLVDPLASVSAAPTSLPLTPPSATGSLKAEPVLEVVADAPIAKIIAPSADKVSLERGRAFVTVTPWKGDLTVEAELANGALARGTAHEGGPTLVQLTTMKRVAGSRPRPKPTASASAKGGLHDDPYKK